MMMIMAVPMIVTMPVLVTMAHARTLCDNGIGERCGASGSQGKVIVYITYFLLPSANARDFPARADGRGAMNSPGLGDGFVVHDIAPDIRVRVTRTMPPISPEPSA